MVKMRFGSLTGLKSNLFLSPLAGYTNLPFPGSLLREIGGLDLATTDLVNARSLLEKNRKALKLIETCPADRPLAVQLFRFRAGRNARCREALPRIARARHRFCWISTWAVPSAKVCRVGGGSAMMTELTKTSALVKGMVDAVKIPVTRQ